MDLTVLMCRGRGPGSLASQLVSHGAGLTVVVSSFPVKMYVAALRHPV